MDLRAPISVDINITKRCNLKCGFCSAEPVGVGAAPPGGELSALELRDLFQQIDKMGVFYIRLAGGEPLIRQDIYDILKDLANFSFHKLVLTNGIPLSKNMVSALSEAGFGTIGISLDGPTSVIHDDHRGVGGTFNRVLQNLEYVRAARIQYSAQCVVTKYNVHQMVEMVKLCVSEGFYGLKFILLNLSGNARESTHFFANYQEWKKGFLELNEFIKRSNPNLKISILPPHEDPVPYELYYPLKEASLLSDLQAVWDIDASTAPPSRQIGCAAGRTQLSVFEDGSVYGCDLMRDQPTWQAGNIRNSSLQSIWDDAIIFRRLRALQKKQLTGPCGGCSYDGCGGGCRASAFNMHNAIDASDSNCMLTR